MIKFTLLLALLALSHAAPAPSSVEEVPSHALSRPSPINPDVISDPKPTGGKVVLLKDDLHLHRQKRDEEAPAKPHSVIARENLNHNPSHLQEQPSLKSALPAVAPAVPAVASAVPAVAPAVSLPASKKEKREAPSKLASVSAHEPLKHDPKKIAHGNEPAHQTHEAHDQHRHQRDIPVPTEIKTTHSPSTTKSAEEDNTTPVLPLRHRPKPVAELFHQEQKPTQSSSSSEKEQQE